jgi:hypothetical protein
MQKNPNMSQQEANDIYFRERLMERNASFIINCSTITKGIVDSLCVVLLFALWLVMAAFDKLAMLIVAAELFGTLLGEVWRSNFDSVVEGKGHIWQVKTTHDCMKVDKFGACVDFRTIGHYCRIIGWIISFSNYLVIIGKYICSNILFSYMIMNVYVLVGWSSEKISCRS